MTQQPGTPKGPATDVLDIAGGIAVVTLLMARFDVGPEWLSVLAWPAFVVVVIDLIWLFAVRMPRWKRESQ